MKTHAEIEFLILNKTVKNPILAPFEKEIITLCEKVGTSGQSGGSLPYTAKAISSAVETLLNFKPITPISGIDEEWMERLPDVKTNGILYQNIRLSSVFKIQENNKAYYLDAIVFNEVEKHGNRFTSNGSVLDSNGKVVTSKQYIKEFPFTPKTFYIDVISTRYDKNKETGELTLNPDGDWWEHVIHDEEQLKPVFEYYERYE